MSMQDEDVMGAIDTSDDNSGAAPVAAPSPGQPTPGMTPAQDDSGTSPAAPGAAPGGQSAEPTLGNAPPSGPLGGVGKRIIAYLMGGDAAHPDTLDQLGKQVDPEGRMTPADRNLASLDAVYDKGGPQAAWPILQANRVAYNAQTAFAKTALQGTPQKPADLDAAIDAANKAQGNVLDGSNVNFSQNRNGGVTATVTMHGTSQQHQIDLTPQQFGQFLDVGGDGQWDKIMDQSAPATLHRLARSTPAQAGAPGAQAQGPATSSTPTLNPRKAELADAAGTGSRAG